MSQPTAVHPPLEGAKLVIGTIAVSLAVFMNVLDTSIANVSIPSISGDLGVAADQGTWVITSFAVANAISVPLTGWLTQRFGQVRLFMTSIVLFVIASWLCGLAPTLPFLLAARVLQGAVAGPMIPLSQTLLLASYPRAKAPMALSMWSMTTLIAPVAGPILGGWISDNISWPWIFYVNIPVGIVAAIATFMIFRERDSVIRKAPIDTVGLGLLVIWVASLQIMLDKGKDLDWFNSTTIVVLTLIAVIALAFFIVWELTEEHPVVDLSLFKLRNFTGGTVALAIGYGLYFGNLVLLPLWLQTDIGYTATDAGLVLAAHRSPQDRDRRVPRVRASLLDALTLYDGRRYVFADAADLDPGYRHGWIFHSAGVHHAVRVAGKQDSSGVGVVELRADHVRRYRDIDIFDGLGPSLECSSRAACGAG
jgi:MFS transporter, DHA2 family, multidrug resistance protein